MNSNAITVVRGIFDFITRMHIHENNLTTKNIKPRK